MKAETVFSSMKGYFMVGIMLAMFAGSITCLVQQLFIPGDSGMLILVFLAIGLMIVNPNESIVPVSNLLVVLCGDKSASPVNNTVMLHN